MADAVACPSWTGNHTIPSDVRHAGRNDWRGKFHYQCLTRLQRKPVLQVAELLLVRGLAQVVRHRTDDERSRQYESLMNAEASGMSSKKGMHNKSKDPPVHYYNDVSLPSTSANQAKQYLPFFQRGKQKGIVEFVLSGARLKVCSSASHLAAYALHHVCTLSVHFGSPKASVSRSG